MSKHHIPWADASEMSQVGRQQTLSVQSPAVSVLRSAGPHEKLLSVVFL